MSEKERRKFDEHFNRHLIAYMKEEQKKPDKEQIRQGNMTAEGRLPAQKYLEAEATLAANTYCKEYKEEPILMYKTPKFNKASTGRCHKFGCASKTANHLVYGCVVLLCKIDFFVRFHILIPDLWETQFASIVHRPSTNMKRIYITLEKDIHIAATMGKQIHQL
jgi:hypothetical protein